MPNVKFIHPRLEKMLTALTGVCASVLRLSRLGFSDPILWVGFKGKNYPMLIKPASEDMTNDEDDFLTDWRGQSSIIHTTKDALNVLGY